MSHEDFIRVFSAFKNSSPETVGEILSSSQRRKFAKDSILYMEGDSCSGIALFLSGEVRVFKTAESGREITLYEIYPGETCILNASCILSRREYPANAVSVTDGEMLLLPEGTFRNLLAKYEEMRSFVFSFYVHRLATVMELIEEVAFGKMDSRLIDYLIEKASDGELQTTHQRIANDLGTSREVVSRLLKDLERKGRISLSRNMIRLIDL